MNQFPKETTNIFPVLSFFTEVFLTLCQSCQFLLPSCCSPARQSYVRCFCAKYHHSLKKATAKSCSLTSTFTMVVVGRRNYSVSLGSGWGFHLFFNHKPRRRMNYNQWLYILSAKPNTFRGYLCSEKKTTSLLFLLFLPLEFKLLLLQREEPRYCKGCQAWFLYFKSGGVPSHGRQ